MEFTEQELNAIRSEFCRGFTDEQFQVCMTFCRVRNLMPGKHVVFSLRKSSEWDADLGAKIKTEKIVFITTIDAARLIAQRTQEYKGQAPEQYIYLDKDGAPSLVSEVPLPDANNRQLPREPWAVRTSIYRKGFDHPITSVARFDAYAVTRRTGEGLVLTEMWQRRGPEMLAKCCEMLSLRKGFPEELSNLYLADEMKQEPAEDEKPHAEDVPAVVAPAPLAVPQVNQAPAQPTESPRPSETVNAPAPPTEPVVSTGKIAESKEQKPTRKPRAKKEEPPADEHAITDEDVEALINPTPDPVDREAIRDAAHEAIEAATTFTPEEAAAQGLPEPPNAEDSVPSKEEMKAITEHVRALAAAGAPNTDLKNYFLRVSGKSDPKLLSKADWAKAFVELDRAKEEGKLKEFVKENK